MRIVIICQALSIEPVCAAEPTPQLIGPIGFRPGMLIRDATGAMRGTDFDNRHQAIIEGEKAGLAAIAAIKLKVTEKTVTVTKR